LKQLTVEHLSCPSCRKTYEISQPVFQKDSIESANLTCPKCFVTIPVLNGFPLFNEQHLVVSDLSKLSDELFGTREEYIRFLDLKRRKPAFDLYAAFQPFNESTQAIYPILSLMRETLKPGDWILDLWCRTGWTGEFLASEFPEQNVISLWENSSGVLGYKGFRFWLSTDQRRSNLDILFYSPDHPFPFPDETFSVIHGLDTLHRYHPVPLIPECLRVARKKSVIVFPHVHLTNAEPEPFFERGETQLHGKVYEQYFEKLLQRTSKKVFILPENKLFEATADYTLKSEPETTHFNALVLIADKEKEGQNLPTRRDDFACDQNAYVVVNPLYDIDLVGRRVNVSHDSLGGGCEDLFYRHPIYQRRLEEHLPLVLSEEDCLNLYWGERFKNVCEISAAQDKDPGETLEQLRLLESKEVIRLQNVSRSMAELQNYYSRQNYQESPATLQQLWNKAVSLHQEKPFLIWPEDGSVFSYKDADSIVKMTISFLRSHGIQKGDRILIDAKFHPEFFFLFWAAVLQGSVAVPVNPELNDQIFSAVVTATNPKLIFRDPDLNRNTSDQSEFLFGDKEDSEFYEGSFSQLLSEQEPAQDLELISEQQPAVILFTSGSTGMPKGVILSHGALYRSGQIMDRVYEWKSEDRFLGAGNFHTMSGLRNPCIAVVHSGASAVIPANEDVQDPLKMMNLCIQNQVTILNTTPGFLAFWGRASGKAKYFQDHHLRMLLSTGSSLHPAHRETFQSFFQCPVFDYYGLTETTGACILQKPALKNITDTGIGQPCDCLVKIVNEDGHTIAANEVGELAIYSENLMLGYLNNPAKTASRIRNGWLFTGDNARIDDSGCVHLLGRKDRMMIDKNGENIYPEEIEDVIGSVPGITEVFVTQYQDESLIDRIAALVSFSQNQNDPQNISNLRSALSKILPDQHIPYLIIPVSTIPKNTAGKVSIQTVHEIIRGSH
jgi:acyl-coenzyme A synthetase/AMP-(fatty) acid ligase